MTATAPRRVDFDQQPADHSRIGVAIHRLDRVATQIEQHAEELVGIGIDFKAGLDPAFKADGGVLVQAKHLGDVASHPGEGDQPAVGFALTGAAIGERRLAIIDGAAERRDQLWRKALHGGIGQGRDPVREELGRG